MKKIDITNLQVIYEDNHLIAVNKPSGILSQGDSTKDYSMIDVVKSYIKIRYHKPGDVFLGCIHRLDRPSSGAMVFARTSKALVRMNDLLKNRKIKKEYLCLVSNRPPEPHARLENYIRKNNKANYVTVHQQPVPNAKKAILKYTIKADLGHTILLHIELQTGRPHQIRSQLAAINCPIVGDTKYGSLVDGKGKIALHSRSIRFLHPVKKEPVVIVSDTPFTSEWKLFSDFID